MTLMICMTMIKLTADEDDDDDDDGGDGDGGDDDVQHVTMVASDEQ